MTDKRARGENVVPCRRGSHCRIPGSSNTGHRPRIVRDAVHHGHARHLHVLAEHLMLRHASADVVAGDHNRALVPKRI
jgi:hypothetical protein